MKPRKTDVKITDIIYYNKEKDICIVLYPSNIVIYYNRIPNTTEISPFCYNDSVVYTKEND